MTFRGSAGFTESWDHFDFSVEDGVGTVTFSRPERLHALTFEVYADLRDLLTQLPHRDDVRALLITGTGRGFCSGGDVDAIIGELLKMPTKGLLDFTRMTGSVVQLMRESPLPIVAGVNGIAAGAGAVIAMAADLRILARSASFRFLFTNVGLSGADMGIAYLLPRIVGLGRASEILLFGDKIEAERAEQVGLANQLVDDEGDRGRVLAGAPRVGRRGQNPRRCPRKQRDGEVIRGTVHVAKAHSSRGAVKRSLDNAVLPRMKIPRARQASCNSALKFQLCGRVVLDQDGVFAPIRFPLREKTALRYRGRGGARNPKRQVHEMNAEIQDAAAAGEAPVVNPGLVRPERVVKHEIHRIEPAQLLP